MPTPAASANIDRSIGTGNRRRARLVIALLGLLGLALAGRLIQLQWVERAKFAERANRQRTFVETIAARPGNIVDRNGRLLAATIVTHSLYADPSRIDDPARFADRVAPVLGLDAERLTMRLRSNAKKKFLWIERRLTEQQAAAVRSLKLRDDQWGFRREFLRRYPQGRLAAHILGLRGIDGRGRGGIEQKFDALLRGSDGERVLVRDARGKAIDVDTDRDRLPRHGRSVVLSLDAVVQLFAEKELDRVVREWQPKTACAIVVDPADCELLAMASRPAFDPNNPANVPPAAWKNTAIASMYEPGSTIKPLFVAWAVDRGVVARDERFDCEGGAFRMGRRVLHDSHPYGTLSLTNVLVKSSNIGMAKIGQRLTNPSLYEAAITFGFGRRTGMELPGEIAGLLRPLERWDLYSTGSIPMGQELAVTPLQMIAAHAALANGGRLLNPRLLLGKVESDRNGIDAARHKRRLSSGMASPAVQVVTQTVRPETAAWLVAGPMREVVERGTGREARLREYTVFGKSGTAQKLDPKTGRYAENAYVCSFVCGAPAEDPRVLVLVLVDEPTTGSSHFGGTVAAPAAGRILRKALLHRHVPTDGARTRTAENR